MLPLLALALALAVQPASAQELSTVQLSLDQEQERVIPSAALATEHFDISAAGLNQPLVRASGHVPSGVWNGRGEEPLFDNGPLVNCPGCVNGFDASTVQTGLGMNTWGSNASKTDGPQFRIADDFSVPEAGWNIETVLLFAYQTGSDEQSTIIEVNLRIWDGLPDAPGSTVVFGDTETNRMLGTEWAQIYRNNENEPQATNRPIMVQIVEVNTELEEGQYWLDWQFDGSLASGPWQPFVTINGVCETGDAWQLTADGWQPLADSASECPQGAPFLIFGDEKIVNTEEGGHGLALALEAIHPNPVVNNATVTFTLAQASEVDLGVYDLLGRRVAVAASGEFAAGEHSVGFDSAGFASGVYVVRLVAGNEVATRRVTVVR